MYIYIKAIHKKNLEARPKPASLTKECLSLSQFLAEGPTASHTSRHLDLASLKEIPWLESAVEGTPGRVFLKASTALRNWVLPLSGRMQRER